MLLLLKEKFAGTRGTVADAPEVLRGRKSLLWPTCGRMEVMMNRPVREVGHCTSMLTHCKASRVDIVALLRQ